MVAKIIFKHNFKLMLQKIIAKLQWCVVLLILNSNLGYAKVVRIPVVNLIASIIQKENGQVVIRWQTMSDLGVIYYDLMRYDPYYQHWRKVNSDPVISSNSIAGGIYEVVDDFNGFNNNTHYQVVQTDQDGMVSRVELVASYANAIKYPIVIKPAVSSVVNYNVVPKSHKMNPMGLSSLGRLDGAMVAKITTVNYGLQAINCSDLAVALGQPSSVIQTAILQNQFHLTTSGQSVTYISPTDGSSILFYAEPHQDNYSTNNVYWLTAQTNLVAGYLNAGSPVPNLSDIWYSSSNSYERNLIYSPSLPLGPEEDSWMWKQLVAIPVVGFNTFPFFFSADQLSQGVDRMAQINITLWGGVATANTIKVVLNTNNILGQWNWYGLTSTNINITVPSALLVSGSNKLALSAIGTGSPTSQWYLNKISVSYPRTYTAVTGIAEFSANNNSVITVKNFSSTNVNVVDVTNPKNPQIYTNISVQQVGSTYQCSFTPNGQLANSVAYESGAVKSVENIEIVTLSGYASSTNTADYVIVSPQGLLPAATNLAFYRQQTGLKTIITPLDQVYNEFAFGFPTPHAIQNLISNAFNIWSIPPKYVVLLGRGTYDYLDINQFHDNLVPSMMVSTPSGIFASDSIYGQVNTNQPPQVAVGRLSGLTTNDLFNTINKIKAYESKSTINSTNAMLIADVDGIAGNFTDEIGQVNQILENKFTDTILSSTNEADGTYLHSNILSYWHQGVDLVNYIGHGAITQFGTAGYLTFYDITNSLLLNQLNNGRMPLVAAMTCVAGQYSVPGNPCLGESLLQPTNGGAIAFFGPTGLSLSGEASELNNRVATLLRSNSQLGLGDMIRQAMADYLSQDQPSVPGWIYNLLGDPALHYSIARDLSPLQITAISPTNVVWTGGLPPYQMEATTNLMNGWQSKGVSTISSQESYTNNGSKEYFRVISSQ